LDSSKHVAITKEPELRMQCQIHREWQIWPGYYQPQQEEEPPEAEISSKRDTAIIAWAIIAGAAAATRLIHLLRCFWVFLRQATVKDMERFAAHYMQRQ
jgi:hypothetical protein